MVLTSGFYVSSSQKHMLSLDSTGLQVTLAPAARLAEQPTSHPEHESHKFSLRRNRDSWLSVDDGKLGKYGDPQQLRVSVEGKEWRVWVEQRGPQLFGLIPCGDTGDYSNLFLGVSDSMANDKSGSFVIEKDWLPHCVWTIKESGGK